MPTAPTPFIRSATSMALAFAIALLSNAAFAASLPEITLPETTMTQQAHGTFEVKLSPQSLAHEDAGNEVRRARLSIDKQFRGDLEATSLGEMLSAMGTVTGSAGYVAIEVVSGTLHGRRGSFALQHSGIMDRGVPSLTVRVVPDSGTGELAGIRGAMDIVIAEGRHSYVFDYALN